MKSLEALKEIYKATCFECIEKGDGNEMFKQIEIALKELEFIKNELKDGYFI